MSFYGKASKPKYRAKLFPAGDYECRVISALEKANEDGEAYIEFEFKVREDVETNECKGQTLKKRFRQDSEGHYKENKINEFACACGVEEGEDYQLEELAGACVICHVSHFTDKTTGEARHYISYLRESEVGDTAQTLNADEFATISNDDIPF